MLSMQEVTLHTDNDWLQQAYRLYFQHAAEAEVPLLACDMMLCSAYLWPAGLCLGGTA